MTFALSASRRDVQSEDDARDEIALVDNVPPAEHMEHADHDGLERDDGHENEQCDLHGQLVEPETPGNAS